MELNPLHKKARIVIADAHDVQVILLAQAIREAGFGLQIAESSEEAFLCTRHTHPHILIIGAPSGSLTDGLELARQVRHSADCCDTHLVFLIPENEGLDFERLAYAHGAEWCIRRPANAAEMLDELSETIEYQSNHAFHSLFTKHVDYDTSDQIL